MKEFLPIGSIVLLKETKKKLMVIGRVQICDGKAFQYSGVLYPEGYMGSDKLYLFNDSDIETIYYMGMQDEDEFNFRQLLMEKVQEEVAFTGK